MADFSLRLVMQSNGKIAEIWLVVCRVFLVAISRVYARFFPRRIGSCERRATQRPVYKGYFGNWAYWTILSFAWVTTKQQIPSAQIPMPKATFIKLAIFCVVRPRETVIVVCCPSEGYFNVSKTGIIEFKRLHPHETAYHFTRIDLPFTRIQWICSALSWNCSPEGFNGNRSSRPKPELSRLKCWVMSPEFFRWSAQRNKVNFC